MFLTAAFLSAAASAASAADVKINCDIQRGPCIQKTGDGMTVEFDIQPKPVTAMSDLAFVITVTRHGVPVTDSSVALDLTMPGMVMGKNLPVLKRLGVGRFEGKGIIPRCPTGKKTWQADVIVVRAGKTDVAGFVFEVK
jgi:hypothetical protein